jgi:hypothetical protein
MDVASPDRRSDLWKELKAAEGKVGPRLGSGCGRVTCRRARWKAQRVLGVAWPLD